MSNSLNSEIAEKHEKPSIDLLNRVRGQFIASGTSMAAWCRNNGVKRQNASAALVGRWKGPGATLLVQKLIIAANSHE